MPRRRRREEASEFGPLDREQRLELLKPACLGVLPDSPTHFESEERRRLAWEEHGEEVLEGYLESGSVFSRPFGYWRYELGLESAPFDPPPDAGEKFDGWGNPRAVWLAEAGDLTAEEVDRVRELGWRT